MSVLSLPLGAARNIILIGDEGITIYDTVSNGNVAYVNELEWTTPDFESALQRILKDECKKKPVLFLHDMVEQYYRMERVPKVSPMDKKNVVARKLAVTFPNYKISAALPLKAKKKKSGPKDGGSYLFAAVPSSELLSTLIRAVVNSGLPLAGLCLLPVESVDMVERLSKRLPRDGKRAKWTLFMGQHSNGNLRQIVTRDGELALTRMTPFTKSQTDVLAWVDELVREFKGSTGYLSRLGYAPDDGIDVIIIGPEEAGFELEERIGAVANVHMMSLTDAARMLMLKIDAPAQDQYADILHVSWIGKKRSFILPLKVKEVEKINQPRLVASFLSLLLVCGFGYLAWQTFNLGSEYLTNRADLVESKDIFSRKTAEYNVLLDDQKEQGYDIRLFKGAFSVQDELNNYSIRPFKLLRGTSLALGPSLNLDELTLRHDDNVQIKFEQISSGGPGQRNASRSNVVPMQAVEDGKYKVYFRLTMSFAPNIQPREAERLVNSLIERIETALPGYDATIEKGVKDLSYEVDMEGEVGGPPREEFTKDDYVAVIEVRGDV